MVVTRSQQGDERSESGSTRRERPTIDRAQPSVSVGAAENVPRPPPVLDAFLSSSSAVAAAAAVTAAASRVSPHEESTTGMSTEDMSTNTRREGSARSSTLRPGAARSVRSAASRKRLLAELEAKERLAELQLKKAQAEEEIQKLRLQRLHIEEEDEDEEMEEDCEDELESVRIQEWIKRTPLKEKDTAQPPPEEKIENAAKGETQQRENGNKHDKTEETRRASEEKGTTHQAQPVVDVAALAATLLNAARSNREPPKYIQELPYFNGSSHEWLGFKAAYESSSKYFSSTENLARIRKSLRGAAKEAVGCLMLSQPDPRTVLDALERRFGRPEALIHAEIEKIKSLHRVTDNPRDLCIFAGNVSNIVGTIEALKKPHYLYNPELARIVVEKLTPILRNKWYDFAAKKKEESAEIKKLSVFLNEEADKCGAYALPEVIKEERSFQERRNFKKERTFTIKKDEAEYTACPSCKKQHKLTECEEFLRSTVKERWEIAKSNRICFRCLKSKHKRFNCRAAPCGKNNCTMRHHKLLHYEARESAPETQPLQQREAVTSTREVVAAASHASSRRSYLKIVPVVLSGPLSSIETYALCDEGSTVTLIDASIADVIGADGPKKGMWLQGISSEMRHEDSKAVSLKIRGRHAHEEYTIDSARTVNRLEFAPETVKKEDMEDCSHLQDILEEITYERASPKILLGQDNIELIVTRQLRAGKKNQPVASYTQLGWVLHGCQSSLTGTVAFCGNIKEVKNTEEDMEELIKNHSRLELQAALLGARLAQTVLSEHEFEVERKVYWSDSRTALAWIRAEPRTFKTFVAHRLAEIEDTTKKNEWRWLPTKDNVADDATRATPSDFNSKHRWFEGPSFLKLAEEQWPQETKQENSKEVDEERKPEKCHVGNLKAEERRHPHLPHIEKFSKWTRLIRTTARVLQFIRKIKKNNIESTHATRKRTRKNKDADPCWSRIKKSDAPSRQRTPLAPTPQGNYEELTADLLIEAEELWVKASQQDSFHEEKIRVEKNMKPASGDRLAALVTYIDEKGILRLRGRVAAASGIPSEQVNPAILDGRHQYTRLYIQHVHEKLHHGGVEMVVNELRQRAWIIKIRPIVRDVIKSCIKCRFARTKPSCPVTGDLPASRLAHHARPFSFTGLDYFGPIEVTVARHREKRYGALFTCMTSRAIHIEIAHSLSADSAISALRRFIARRGCPKEIWSDNATCFKAADKELAEAALNGLQHEVTARHIKWKYIVPGAPFMGGAWERMVRAVKEALKTTLHERCPSDETLATLLIEVENTVNSRPLTHVAVSPEEPEALTPNHILIGPNCHVPPPGHFEERDLSAKQQWRRAQALADIFWRRWVKEYLPMLQHRREPHNADVPPKVGDYALICDPNLPRNTWPRGRIVRVYPGADGEVRIVDIQLSSGNVLQRPTRKVVVIPGVSPSGDGGRNVHDEENRIQIGAAATEICS